MDNPEAALQKENCIFCQIVEGKIPSRKVFEDDAVLGILDINPANAGHILLMPKEHFIFMPQVPPGVIGRLFVTARILSNAALRAVRSDGTTLFVANGGIAGQRAPHFMVHLIPRIAGDGLALSVGEGRIAPEVQEQVKRQVMGVLEARFGVRASGHSRQVSPDSGKSGREKRGTDGASGGRSLDAIADLLAGGKRG